MYMNYVFLNYSYAVNRIPLPMAGSTVIVATPYVYLSSPPPPPPPPSDYTLGNPRSDVGGSGPEFPATVTDRSYYNINWLVSDRFFYGFTEDWDHNGKIDRIRIQAGFRVTGSAEASFSNNKFVVVVEGYEVTRYARADEDTNTPPLNSDAEGRMQDMIYVYVKEKDYTDTGARPVWWVARNEGVFDLSTKTIPLQLPEKEKMEAWDNVPPWINYALTVPKAKFTRAGYTDKGEIFVQFSESVHAPSLGPITLSSGSIDLSGIWDLDSRGREFIIPLMAPYSLGDLAAIPPTFTLTKLQDNADYARDRRSSGAIYAYQYPSPKYPIDWDYKDYVEVQGDPLNLWNRPSAVGINFTVVNPSGGTLPETVPKKDAVSLSLGADTGNKGVGIFPLLSHRVTDLLVSVPPTTVGDTQYFVWPLWAKYKTLDPEDYDGTLGGVPGPGYGYMNSGGAFSDTTVIWDFTGKRFLERSDDVLLQARVNTGVPAPAMAAVSNVPDSYKASAVHGPQGLWLPSASPSFRNMVPDFYPMGTSSMTPAGTGLYNYTFPKTTYGAGNSAVEFFFHLSGSPADLFAGRLHIAPGEAVPSNWYRLVRPFSFGLHNITRQRGGVTILNNVINSEKRENVFLDYKLEKSGRVTVQVFTLDGNLVKVLVRENQGAKDTYYRAAWDGTNKGGRAVARGMYFIRIVAPDIDEIRKVMVVK
jgi:hypothetical protein